MTDIIIFPTEWVRAHRYCEVTGEPMDTVELRIREGVWAAGKHYKRTGPRTLWVNMVEANKWVSNQQHVESMRFPKASKSDKARPARASA